MSPTSISEALEEFESEHLPQDAGRVQRERVQLAFYRAALFVLNADAAAQQRMRGECIDFGRSLGRRAA